jgi:2-amino-4-hydroxy-6-hydroxymethyldihydropteridine diphosphokinase
MNTGATGHIAYIGLGANLGEMEAALNTATAQIAATNGIRVTAQSSRYRTAPIDSGGGDYLNAVIQIETHLNPLDLLAVLQKIENAAGRERPYRNAPRTLDLDILLFNNEIINLPNLIIPHPRMAERAFVLIPLREIAPELVSLEMLEKVRGQGIEKITAM